jgi:hypothetical protein
MSDAKTSGQPIMFQLTHVALGHGGYIITAGTDGGVQSVFIEPVAESGKVGAKSSDGTVSGDRLESGSVIITLDSPASAHVLRRRCHCRPAAAPKQPGAPCANI